MPDVIPLRLLPGEIELLDQTLLPHEERYIPVRDVPTLCEAIRSLRVRGAPLLGLAGAAGLAIAARTTGPSEAALRAAAAEIVATRPTAVDLAACTHAALGAALSLPESERDAALWAFAANLRDQRLREDRAIGEFGAALLAPGDAVLTHCNTGALATGGMGTALAVIRVAFEQGKLSRCFATETRPLLQGARLTAWELARLGIPATLLPDTAAASLIASGRVQAVITGADRIGANGDSANKVGTYGLAAVAARHGVPFYIAAPRTTIDLACPDGAHIPIEFRAASEVGGFGGQRWAPDGLDAYNPAFDVTPAELIAGIITDCGAVRPPYRQGLSAIMRGGETT
ncbi:MAG: S-methyl-5-thioribose-1-phosphate isomerase [Hyphomicrobiales bacterium]